VATLKSANILPSCGIPSCVKKPIEDKLFDEGCRICSTDELLRLIAKYPLMSCILNFDTEAFRAVLAYMYEQKKLMAADLESCRMKQNHLTSMAIPEASKDLAYWENQIQELEGLLQQFKMEVEACADKYNRLQANKDSLTVRINSIEQKVKVTTIMVGTMEQLSHFHTNKTLQQQYLPLANISTENDDSLRQFMAACELSTYDSTNKPQRQLVAIARSAKMLGLAYSPYFIANGFQLHTGKGNLISEHRVQICNIFKIPIPKGNTAAAAASPLRKRKNQSDITEQAIDTLMSTDVVKDLVLTSPKLRKLVTQSESLTNALFKSTRSPKKKKGVPPEGRDGN